MDGMVKMKIRASYFTFRLLMLLILLDCNVIFSLRIIPLGLNIFRFHFLKSRLLVTLNVLCSLLSALGSAPLPTPHDRPVFYMNFLSIETYGKQYK